MTQASHDEIADDAGARFDAILAMFKNAWAEEYPLDPFDVDGVVTPRAMAFIAGYAAALKSKADEWPTNDRPGAY